MINPYLHTRKEIKINLYAIIIGLVASLTGYLFRTLVDDLDEVFYSENSFINDVFPNNIALHTLVIILVPTIGGLIVGFGVYYISEEAKGHGIPNVMKSMHTEGGKMEPKVPIAKFILSIITIGSGNSAGSEGPIAQIGAGLGSTLGQRYKLSKGEINILVATGASAGIAAVFNAPLGGALFGIEILLASITLRSVIPVIVGCATAIATNDLVLNNYQSVFQVPKYNIHYPIEYGFILILGGIIAIVGMIWQKSLEIAEEKFDGWNIKLWYKTALGGLLSGILLKISISDLRGSSYNLIQDALEGENYTDLTQNAAMILIITLMFFVFVKIALTSLSLGSGQSGGVFSPSLLMGAMTGVSFGIVLHFIFPSMNINPGLYAVLGMASLFGGVARAPLTMVIITTEMSGEYGLFTPLMLIIAVSYLSHNYLLKESIYTSPLVKYGVSTHTRTIDDVLNFIPVREAMASSVVCVYEDTPVSMLSDIFICYHHLGYLVVDKDYHIKGIVTLTDLRLAKIKDKEKLFVRDIMTKDVITTNPNSTIKETIDLMYRNGIGRVPIAINSGKANKELIPVGIFTRSDIMKTLESIHKLHVQEHNKSIKNFKKKITEPFITVIPSSFPDLQDKVVKIEYDWIQAYQKVVENNQLDSDE